MEIDKKKKVSSYSLSCIIDPAKDDHLTSLGLLVLVGTELGFATVGELWEHRSNNLPEKGMLKGTCYFCFGGV